MKSRVLAGLFLSAIALCILSNSARAQLYVSQQGNGTVAEYDAITGAPINPNFITGLSQPAGLALQVQAVPEPSTWAVSALCFATLLFRRFSRRSA